MNHLERLVLTLVIIFVSLGLGYWARRYAEKGRFFIDSEKLDRVRHHLQTLSVFGLLPLSAMLSLWGLPKPESSLLAFPLLGLASYVWGGFLALLLARFLKLDRPQTGSFYCCGTFTNIGAVGGLVCLLFLGENSIALVALYRLLDEVFYFSVSFPIAKMYAPGSPGMLNFRKFKFNPVLAVIICALLCGMILNLAGVPRPRLAGIAASACMLLATMFFLVAIGLTLRLSRVWNYKIQGLAMCAIKFIGVPVVITAMAAAMGFGGYDDGLALKVVAVLSSMPVAMTALVPPSLFRLDVDMANACWIFSTGALIITLPVLIRILPAL